ncbi:MAG: hypothetical protein ACLFTE_07890 [Salinivenus sp.]
MPTSNGSPQDLPAWMQIVDEDVFYNAPSSSSPEEEAASPAGPPASSPGTQAAGTQANTSAPSDADATASRTGDASLLQKLRVALGDAAQIPDLKPDQQPVPAGSIRADLNRQLEQAVAVLNTRYAHTVSKPLVLEFALRQTLLDLQKHDTGSALVQWLDAELPQQ